MIKLRNIEAIGFLSPALNKLFSDETRTFPLQDAFKITDAIEQIRLRSKQYFESQRKIITDNGGTIHEDGTVTYSSFKNQQEASEEIEKLNNVELEYSIDKIKVGDDWPKLTLSEASILKPILSY